MILALKGTREEKSLVLFFISVFLPIAQKYIDSIKNTIELTVVKKYCVKIMLKKLVGKEREEKITAKVKYIGFYEKILSENPTKKIKLARKLTREKMK